MPEAATTVDVLVGLHGVQCRLRAVVTWGACGTFTGYSVDQLTPPDGAQLLADAVQVVGQSPAVRMQVRQAAELIRSRWAVRSTPPTGA